EVRRLKVVTHMLVRLKLAGVVMPLEVAEMEWLPPTPLAAAVTLAVPEAPIVAGLPLMAAEAPLVGGVKVIRPPATGSLELLAFTVTTSGAAKGVEFTVD